jgi:hypothetical protein
MSMFAKRHYVAIAALMAAQGDKNETWKTIREDLVAMFRADNGMFKPDRFRDACEKNSH